MKNLIPHFIQSRLLEGRSNGAIRAYTMFIDLSGFTQLTETLMGKGNRGAEELSQVLNEIFGPLVQLVYARGGCIPYFAGDAFTAVFPVDQPGVDQGSFVQTAFLARNLFSDRQFMFHDFKIGMKIGLSFGEVEWGIVGDRFKSFYFRGQPIDNCAECQTKASFQEIILDQLLLDQMKGIDLEIEEVDDQFYRIAEERTFPDDQTFARDLPALEPDVVRQFLPPSVADMQQDGEFRTVIAVFISFAGVNNHQLLNTFASIVLDQINSFSGYFKEIEFGDKGGVMVGFFGAPVSFENSVDRALEFVTAMGTSLKELQQRTGFRFRAGITVGTAYTGFVGGEERCQYAAVGNRVNLAARLMTFADWGEVLVDAEIRKNRNFQFLHKGDIRYKGIKGFVPTYKLVGRNYENQLAHSGQMIGRNSEFQKLIDFARPLHDNRFAGVACIFGEAGIGKSRLTHELRKFLVREKLVRWEICQTDQILKKPFNPFINFLKNYFSQSLDVFAADNLQLFEARFSTLLETLSEQETTRAETIRKELVRTKSVLAALIGISYPDSLWEQLDAKGRYQNTLIAIVNLFLAESLLQPLVIELEDGHWLDENSLELLQEFIRQIHKFPILLLITSRYKDDGSKPTLIHPNWLQSYQIPQLEVNLNILQQDSVRAFATAKLGGAISDEFFELLLRITNSNPFYLEQVIEYFTESQLLEFHLDQWNIKGKNFQLSSSINAILTARIDRLSYMAKETVKAAAVIGREFDLPILTEVMKENEEFIRHNQNDGPGSLLKEQIQIVERGQIWLALSELRYIFRHSLLREAAYSMQLQTRLQQLHRSIAEAIERLYHDNMEERYVDLAFHYEQAGVFDKTCEYLRKAADYARRNYQNQRALDFYEKLLEKLGTQEDTNNKVKTHLKRGKILELIGEWDECENAYKRALILAKKLRDVLLLGQANNSLGHLLMLKGDYPNAKNYLQTSAQLFESIDDKPGIAKVYGNLGNLFFRHGNYEDAKSYFLQSIRLGREDPSSGVNAQIAANLGLTYMNQGHLAEGIQCMLHQLKISRQHNDKQGIAILHTYLGIVYLEKGDYENALLNFQQGLEKSEELGNKQMTAIATGNIGIVFERQGDYQTAMEHFQRDLELTEELGDKQGIAIALGLIGELLSYQGQFHKAIEHLQKNLMLCEELGYKKGIAKAVNTLGDVFFFTRQFDRSLHYYNRAIELTRTIGNKLVLGFSLVEKGLVLVELGDMESLQATCREALRIAEDLGNPDLIFEARLLVAKTHFLEEKKDEAIFILYDLLTKPLSQAQEAAVHFEFARILPKAGNHASQALALYNALYSQTPKFVYKKAIETLQAKA